MDGMMDGMMDGLENKVKEVGISLEEAFHKKIRTQLQCIELYKEEHKYNSMKEATIDWIAYHYADLYSDIYDPNKSHKEIYNQIFKK